MKHCQQPWRARFPARAFDDVGSSAQLFGRIACTIGGSSSKYASICPTVARCRTCHAKCVHTPTPNIIEMKRRRGTCVQNQPNISRECLPSCLAAERSFPPRRAAVNGRIWPKLGLVFKNRHCLRSGTLLHQLSARRATTPAAAA